MLWDVGEAVAHCYSRAVRVTVAECSFREFGVVVYSWDKETVNRIVDWQIGCSWCLAASSLAAQMFARFVSGFDICRGVVCMVSLTGVVNLFIVGWLEN